MIFLSFHSGKQSPKACLALYIPDLNSLLSGMVKATVFYHFFFWQCNTAKRNCSSIRLLYNTHLAFILNENMNYTSRRYLTFRMNGLFYCSNAFKEVL